VLSWRKEVLNQSHRPLIKLSFNWLWVLVAIFLWVYGLFVALSDNAISPSKQILITTVLVGLLSLLLSQAFKRPAFFEDQLAIERKDLTVWGSYILIMGTLSYNYLFREMINDPINHSNRALVHVREGVRFLEGIWGDVSYLLLIQYGHWLMVAASAIAIIIFFRVLANPGTNRLVFSLFIIATFLLLRFVSIRAGLQGGADGPLFHFVLWIGQAFGGVGEFGTRVGLFLTLTAFMWLVQKALLSAELPPLTAWMGGLAVGTFPQIWQVGVVVSPSIFLAVFASLLLLTVHLSKQAEDLHWGRWSALLGITILTRNAAIAIAPAFYLLLLWHLLKRSPLSYKEGIRSIFTNGDNFKTLCFALLPALIAMPFILQLVLLGTPTTRHIVAASDVSPIIAILEQVLAQDPVRIIFRDLDYYGTFLLLVGLLPILHAFWPAQFMVWIFFSLALVMFSSTSMANLSRYQAEYALPVAILGLAQLLLYFSPKGNVLRWGVILGLSVLVVSNLFSMPRYVDDKPGWHGLSPNTETGPDLAFTNGYRWANKHGWATGTIRISAFNMYKMWHAIQAGLSLREVISMDPLDEIERECKAGNITAEDINAIALVKVVLLGEDDRLQDYKRGLIELGWLEQSFDQSGHSAYLTMLIREKPEKKDGNI